MPLNGDYAFKANHAGPSKSRCVELSSDEEEYSMIDLDEADSEYIYLVH